MHRSAATAALTEEAEIVDFMPKRNFAHMYTKEYKIPSASGR